MLSSLSRSPSAGPPAGFSRFPFSTGHVDIPDGVPFHWLGFSGRGGWFEVKTYGPKQERDVAQYIVNNTRDRKPEVVEPHSSRPFLDGTIEQARVRLTVSKEERRTAVIRRPGRSILLIDGHVNAPHVDGAPLDGARWGQLVEVVIPLFHTNEGPKRAIPSSK
ncbi:MAG: hypothetical protein IPI67_20295 [Myxococcales bacterium]|nr:hypothetical protein [Myxococcales bacterium]